MARDNKNNIIDMISWLRDIFIDKGYNAYDRYDKVPGLPIHMYCTKTTKANIIKENLVFVVATGDSIKKEFFYKLCFFQSYLSLYMDSDQLKLILVIQKNATIKREKLSSTEDHCEDAYKKRGFGLLKITKPLNDGGKADYNYYCRPITPRQRMEKAFIKKFPRLKKESKTLARHFDRYVDEAVFGIAGEYPVDFEERNIDRKLLELIANLKNVTYHESLKQIANEYLSYEKDDYTFAMKWVRTLWNQISDIPYPDIHEKMEPMLKELYPKYRDHFLHQFQVFLLGSILIEHLINSNKIKIDANTLSKGWLYTATFHDFAQAIQKYDDWNKTFFKESLKIEDVESLELKKHYVENTFSSSTEHIISSLKRCFCELDEQNQTENNNKIRRFFYHQITDKKNHGMLSSLSLLKRFEKNGFEKNSDFHSIILPSATAIAIHDDHIWQALSGAINNSEKTDWVSDLCTLKPLSKLKLDVHPLPFLLIFCDNIQDWGRHFRDAKLEKSSSGANVGLKSISSDSNKITIQLFVNFNLDYLKYKKDTLNLVKNLLQASSPHFLIEFWDREKNEKLEMDVEIGD
jgi:hypothetical protein